MRSSYLLFLAAVAALAQTDPKPKPEDYDVHAEATSAAVGAEFMVHSFSGQGQTYIAKDFLVVEVALYPVGDQPMRVSPSAFALRMNGRNVLRTVPPSAVVSALQHPDFSTSPHLEAGGGIGNTGVVLGRPAPSQIPNGPQTAPPRVPRAPQENPSGIEPERPVSATELVVATALQEGPHTGPFSGFIYFPYKGKTSAIRSLELLFEDAVLKIR